MTRVEATELNREDTIRQVTDWCRVQEEVVLSEPGREINLALYRRDVDAVTHGRYSYAVLLDSLANQPLQPKDNVLIRQILVNTHTPQLKFGVREYLDPDGRVLGQEYFLQSLKSKKIRGCSSNVPLSMTGGFW